MKNKWMRLFSIMAVLIMTMSVLAACGGGGMSGGEVEVATLSEEGASVEPNNGIQGITFAMPEGYTLSDVEAGRFSYYEKDGSDYGIRIFAETQETLNEIDREDLKDMTIEDYYKKYYTPDEKNAKENNITYTETKVCDADGYIFERKNDKGVVSYGVAFFYNQGVYDIGMYNRTAEYDENGKIKNELSPATDEDIEAMNYLISSIKPGDGNSMQNTKIEIDSFGDFTFDMPEGFVPEGGILDSNFVRFNKEDGDAFIDVYTTTEEDIDKWEGYEGATDIKGYFEQMINPSDEKIDIEGCEAYLESEDDHYLSAKILSGDTVYSVNLSASEDMWGDDGYVKEDVKALSKEEKEAFKAFVKSFKKK